MPAPAPYVDRFFNLTGYPTSRWSIATAFVSCVAVGVVSYWTRLNPGMTRTFNDSSPVGDPTLDINSAAVQLLIATMIALVVMARVTHWLAMRDMRSRAERWAQTGASGSQPGSASLPAKVSRVEKRDQTVADAPVTSSWSYRAKLWSYLRAYIAFFSAQVLMTAIAHGVTPETGIYAKLGIIMQGALIGTIMLAALGQMITKLVEWTAVNGVPRGIADVGIGTALGGMFLFATVHSMIFYGAVPTNGMIVKGVIDTIAGAIGGFAFWRAERYPGASRRTAQLAARFNSGFLRGLRLAS